MRIWCLTSLTLKSLEQTKGLEIYKFQGLESPPFDNYKTVKHQIIKKYLRNATNYKLSEIRIGKRDGRFYFVLCREGVKLFNILMTKGALIALPRRDAESVVIDILIDNDKLDKDDLPLISISKIRIRAIKNTSVKRMVSNREIEIYNNYAALINQLSGGNPENHEEAIKQLGPIVLPNPSEPKRLQQKITDLYNVINDLCHPETGDISNVLQTARYYNGLYDYEVIRFESRKYDPRCEKTRDFSDCRFLLYDSVNLSGINERWFLAEGLLSLVIKNCNVFTIPGTWKIFENNISKFKHLITLQLSSCKIIQIPEYLFQNAPKSIMSLILFDNDISSIPSSISRLVNLEVLNLNDNPDLDDNGIPWNCLSEELRFIEIKNTKVTKIPNTAKKFSRLKVLNVQGPNLKEIDWDGITDDIEKLSISNLRLLNSIKTTDKHLLNSFSLTNENITHDHGIAGLPRNIRELNLSNNKMTCLIFNFGQPPYSLLTTLILSCNKLHCIPWEVLPLTLEILDLSNNVFNEIETVKNLIELKQLLMSSNNLTKITPEFNELGKLKIIDFGRNCLSSLPKGFEFIFSNYLSLNLSHNKFNRDNGSIEEDLWNRLPTTWRLYLNGNTLRELPCQLIGKIMELQAIDCKLGYICPQIYNNLFNFHNDRRLNIFRHRFLLNIAKNDDLKNLSFIPHTIYPITISSEKPSNEHRYFSRVFGDNELATLKNYPEWSIIVSNKESLRNTRKFPKIGKKYAYNFKPVQETKTEEEGICKCCAYCSSPGKGQADTVMIEQQMMMGCVFCVVNEEIITKAHAYEEPGWQAGKWKTLIRTRLCPNCIQKLKHKIENPSSNNEEQLTDDLEPKRYRATEESEAVNYSNSGMEETANIFVSSPVMDSFRVPIEGPTFGIVEINWIRYILEKPTPFNIPEWDPTWIYSYPSEEYLRGICDVHGIKFDSYPFHDSQNFYSSPIFGKMNLLTVKIEPDQNSGFRALSYLITGCEYSFEKIRNLIHFHIQQHFLPQNFYMVYPPQILNIFTETIRECDLYAATNLFQINIFVFNFYNDGKWFLINESWFESATGMTQFIPHRPSFLLSKTFDNLFNPVLAATD